MLSFSDLVVFELKISSLQEWEELSEPWQFTRDMIAMLGDRCPNLTSFCLDIGNRTGIEELLQHTWHNLREIQTSLKDDVDSDEMSDFLRRHQALEHVHINGALSLKLLHWEIPKLRSLSLEDPERQFIVEKGQRHWALQHISQVTLGQKSAEFILRAAPGIKSIIGAFHRTFLEHFENFPDVERLCVSELRYPEVSTSLASRTRQTNRTPN